jgi:uncharacterized protein
VGEIGHYLDASFLVALLTAEPSSVRAARFVRAHPSALTVSDFAAAEFASAISRRVRMRQMPDTDARLVLAAFDRWMLTAATTVEISSTDVAVAAALLRRLDLTLRTPDAIHIAAAQRLGTALVTLDQRMAAAANALGMVPAQV